MEIIDSLVADILRVNLSSKYWHWITTSEAEHNATTYLYKNLNKLVDVLVESHQGYNNTRITIPSNVDMISYREMIPSVKELISNCETSFNKIDSEDVKNTIAEIISVCNIFMYKLSLR